MSRPTAAHPPHERRSEDRQRHGEGGHRAEHGHADGQCVGERRPPGAQPGEEAGALDNMLFKVAEYYEQEVNNAVDALSSLIEPFIMVIIGVLVGDLVVALYLPIFKVAATVAG